MAKAALLWLAILSSSAGSVGVSTPPARPRPGATYTIVIDKMAFGAAPKNLRVGDAIIWVNRDFLRHTATAADRSFNVDLLPGKSARTVLAHAGTVSFRCTFHPGMKGTLTIAPPERIQ
jgi:plastocyanin